MILAVVIASICLIIIIQGIVYFKVERQHKRLIKTIGKLPNTPYIEYKGKKKKSKREKKMENERRLKK
jgi:hypothetical protein